MKFRHLFAPVVFLLAGSLRAQHTEPVNAFQAAASLRYGGSRPVKDTSTKAR